MKARIQEIRIENYRAIESACLRLDDATFLLGRNGAGKSSILDAVEFVREAVSDNLTNAFDRRGGFAKVKRIASSPTAPLGIALQMQLQLTDERAVRVLYGFQIHQQADGSREIHETLVGGTSSFVRRGADIEGERTKGVAAPAEGLVLNVVTDDELRRLVWDVLRRVRAYELSPHAMRSPAPIDAPTNLNRTGTNVGDVVKDLRSRPEDYAWVNRYLGSITPGLASVLEHVLVNQRMLVFEQTCSPTGEKQLLDSSQVSHGTLRALGVLLALRQNPAPSLVLIDEVEDSIHPGALAALLEAVDLSRDRCPVVLTSHSPEVLSHALATPARVRVVQWRDGVTRLFRLSAATTAAIDPVTTVGDLLRINALFAEASPDAVDGELFRMSP